MEYDRSSKDVLEFLKGQLSSQETYHDQKDKMAYAVGALIVAFGGAYLIGNQPPPTVNANYFLLSLYLIGLVVLWGAAHFILCFQLKSKRIAAIEALALTYALQDAYIGAHPISFTHMEIANKDEGGETVNEQRIREKIKNVYYTMILHKQAIKLRDLSLTSGPEFVMKAYRRAELAGSHSQYVERATWWLSVVVLAALILKTALPFVQGPACWT